MVFYPALLKRLPFNLPIPNQLKIIRSRYQDAFIAAPDLPWWTSPDEYADVTTVRAIDPGAGNMTYMLVGGAGHFVSFSILCLFLLRQ